MTTQKRIPLLAILALIVSLGVSSVALGKTIIGKAGKIVVSEAVQVSGQTLAAGSYKVQHVSEGDAQHFLHFRGSGLDIKVPCRIEPLPKRVEQTQYSSQHGMLVEVRIEGEMFRHILLMPQVHEHSH